MSDQFLNNFDNFYFFRKLIKPFKDDLYSEMIISFDCGPFDGCCVVFAQALQNVIGGDIVVLINKRGLADHAAVELDGKLYDFDGPLKPREFMRRFSKNENVEIINYRKIEDGDLIDAVRDYNLQNALELILNKALMDTEVFDVNFQRQRSI